MIGADDLVEVSILRLPVGLWQRAQEHSDALMREFALMAADPQAAADERHVPRRLLELMRELEAGYAGFTGEQETQLADAMARALPEVDLQYRVPGDAGLAARRLGELLAEADRYCSAGQHLLTLASPPDVVRLREWFLGQFVDQPQGRPAVAWPDYRP